MLPPPGWGEAAPNVRFVSAHLGRRFVTERKRKRGDPAWVGEILSNILIQLSFLQDVSQVEGTENLSTAAIRPPGDRVVTGDHCRTPSYNGPNAAKMRLSTTLTTAVTPPTLQVTAPPLTKPRCTLGGAFALRPVGANRRELPLQSSDPIGTLWRRHHIGALILASSPHS
jgi:hypothetical protein